MDVMDDIDQGQCFGQGSESVERLTDQSGVEKRRKKVGRSEGGRGLYPTRSVPPSSGHLTALYLERLEGGSISRCQCVHQEESEKKGHRDCLLGRVVVLRFERDRLRSIPATGTSGTPPASRPVPFERARRAVQPQLLRSVGKQPPRACIAAVR